MHLNIVHASLIPGAREAPRMWHDLLHNWFVAGGFEVNPHDCCLYTRWQDGVPLHCLVHVDDVLMVGPQPLVDVSGNNPCYERCCTGIPTYLQHQIMDRHNEHDEQAFESTFQAYKRRRGF